MPYELPKAYPIGEALTELLARPTTAKMAPPINAYGKICVVSYIADDGTLIALALFDVAIAASFGAALAMMPVGPVKESIQSGVLSQNLRENAYEVFNIFSGTLNNQKDAPHHKLRDMHIPGDKLPADVSALIQKPKVRADFDVTVNGYASGKLSLFLSGA